jgi:hypothetical protein
VYKEAAKNEWLSASTSVSITYHSERPCILICMNIVYNCIAVAANQQSGGKGVEVEGGGGSHN